MKIRTSHFDDGGEWVCHGSFTYDINTHTHVTGEVLMRRNNSNKYQIYIPNSSTSPGIDVILWEGVNLQDAITFANNKFHNTDEFQSDDEIFSIEIPKIGDVPRYRCGIREEWP